MRDIRRLAGTQPRLSDQTTRRDVAVAVDDPVRTDPGGQQLVDAEAGWRADAVQAQLAGVARSWDGGEPKRSKSANTSSIAPCVSMACSAISRTVGLCRIPACEARCPRRSRLDLDAVKVSAPRAGRRAVREGRATAPGAAEPALAPSRGRVTGRARGDGPRSPPCSSRARVRACRCVPRQRRHALPGSRPLSHRRPARPRVRLAPQPPDHAPRRGERRTAMPHGRAPQLGTGCDR